jgi:glycosyltransferase involved in cell wall biosynthesis
MRQKKIEKELIIFMPSMEGGGVEKNIILISNFLIQHIKNISLITFDDKFKNKFSKKINFIYPNLQGNKKFSKYYKYFICLKMLIKIILKNKNTCVFAFQANIYCIILSKLFNFKIVVRSNSSPAGWSKNIIKNYIFRFFLKRADALIVNSYDFKKEIDRKFNTKAIVIYNPLNKAEIVKKSKEKLKFNFFDSKKSLKIINIARFTDQKDHITLIKAFRIINKKINAKLLLIGYGPNKKKIQYSIKNFRLEKNIKILNYQDNPYKYIAKANLFILTSIYEGLPNVLLECIALKKFIISSNCKTGPREILANNKYGILFKPGDHLELANKIIYFHENKNNLKSKILKGYKSLRRFDFKKNSYKYLILIKKIMQ